MHQKDMLKMQISQLPILSHVSIPLGRIGRDEKEL